MLSTVVSPRSTALRRADVLEFCRLLWLIVALFNESQCNMNRAQEMIEHPAIPNRFIIMHLLTSIMVSDSKIIHDIK